MRKRILVLLLSMIVCCSAWAETQQYPFQPGKMTLPPLQRNRVTEEAPPIYNYQGQQPVQPVQQPLPAEQPRTYSSETTQPYTYRNTSQYPTAAPLQPQRPTRTSNVRWNNDLRSIFLKNQANIVAINIRTFFAVDTNKSGIIDIESGEKPGTFVSAVLGLDDLANAGVNTVHLLPITPVGKMKALGTAGSLYALTSFTEINPQLVDKNVTMSAIDQAKMFIDECHKRKIRVIIDLPSCGAYDYYMTMPHLFEKDKGGQPIVPADWTDVRLFKVQGSNGLNEELYNLHRAYVDMLLSIGADGIRADVATIKPYEFWQRLISYTRTRNPEFLFLAEASDSWTKPPAGAVFTTYDKLLEAGFDGYYGSYFKFKDTKSASEFADIVNFNMQLSKKYSGQKTVIGSFMTHDEQSPILVGGVGYAQQLIWLNALLPVNAYIADGIMTGDNFLYPYANQQAYMTYTDDNTYYVHNGKMDIFNFSRMPGGLNGDLLKEYKMASSFKAAAMNFINAADFKTLNSGNPNVYAYSRCDGTSTILIILNKNLHAIEKAKIRVKGLTEGKALTPIRLTTIPKNVLGGLDVELGPAEVQVFYIPDFKL